MRNFYYYKGNSKDGFKHLVTICMPELSQADIEFEKMFGLDPRNVKTGIFVTLQPRIDDDCHKDMLRS